MGLSDIVRKHWLVSGILSAGIIGGTYLTLNPELPQEYVKVNSERMKLAGKKADLYKQIDMKECRDGYLDEMLTEIQNEFYIINNSDNDFVPAVKENLPMYESPEFNMYCERIKGENDVIRSEISALDDKLEIKDNELNRIKASPEYEEYSLANGKASLITIPILLIYSTLLGIGNRRLNRKEEGPKD